MDYLVKIKQNNLLFSSPEESDLQGELIVVYTHAPGSIVVSRDCQHSPQKTIGLSKPNFMWSLLGKDTQSLYKWARLHNQDGRQANLWLKRLNICFSRP